ncbi:MAG: AAA family ATPase [Labilithrix sp.]|nr:AAA family ATPase [Labilithrix sp.]MCW5810220.1 AAA family ATPase [Labilithrix sp.]
MLVFVVGTGTDVGKTHVTATLVAAAAPARAWKPVVTGPSDDAARIGAIEPPLYAFAPPVSPHLAAREAGVTIAAAAIATRARAIAERASTPLFVESAGGLFSPISDRETNHDVALALSATMLLVAPDRLGVLHDVGAVVRASKVPLPVVALSAPAAPDASTGTNAEEIVRLGLAKHVVEVPRATPDAAPSLHAAAALLRVLA